MNTKNHMINLLPHYLQDGININIYYKILEDMYNEILNDFLDILESRDLDITNLYGLDIIGGVVGQKRNSDDNEIYRTRIKTRVMQNNSRGYIDDINELAKMFLGDVFLGVRQGWCTSELNFEPAFLEILLKNHIQDEGTIKYKGIFEKSGYANSGKDTINKYSKEVIKSKTKYINIPHLENSIPIGVKLKYKLNDIKECIVLKNNSVLKFSTKNEAKINCSLKWVNTSLLECGTSTCSRELGLIL